MLWFNFSVVVCCLFVFFVNILNVSILKKWQKIKAGDSPTQLYVSQHGPSYQLLASRGN